MSDKTLYPGWRSLLFIPVHVDKFVDKAHTRGADAYILDLEDSVPLAQKAEARNKIASAAKKVSVNGASALVRINLVETLAKDDIEASIVEGVAALVIPKVETAEQLSKIDNIIGTLEKQRNLVLGNIKLIAMIESVQGLAQLDNIAQSSERLIAMTLGSEDFSASARMQPTPDTLLHPNQMIVFACRRAGIAPLGFPASIADYSDLDQFANTIKLARQLGFVGALCIHPSQATVLNKQLTPSEEEIDHAKRLIAAFEAGLAEGKGAIEFEGKMVDLPVVENAREMLEATATLS